MTDSKLVFYSLVVNSTIGYSAPVFRSILFPIPYNPVTVNTKKEVDEALMIYFKRQNPDSKTSDEPFTYELTSQGYPVSTQRIFKNFDFFSMRGSFFFYLPIAIAFLIVVTEMNYEKDKGIKMFMISAGMRSGAYWLSWILVNAMLSGYIAATICVTCSLLGVPLFTKVPFWLMFMVFFSSAFGMNTIGFIINVVCYSKTLRQAVSYGFLLISFFFQIFFSAPNSTNIFYSEGFYSSVMTVLKLVLSCYPGYSYTKMFADIVHVSGSFFDTSTFKFSVGKDYTLEDFTNHFTGYLPNGVYAPQTPKVVGLKHCDSHCGGIKGRVGLHRGLGSEGSVRAGVSCRGRFRLRTPGCSCPARAIAPSSDCTGRGRCSPA